MKSIAILLFVLFFGAPVWGQQEAGSLSDDSNTNSGNATTGLENDQQDCSKDCTEVIWVDENSSKKNEQRSENGYMLPPTIE